MNVIGTEAMDFRKALTTSATDTSFLSKIPTGTEPTGAGVHDIHGGVGIMQNGMIVVPFGIGSDNHTFDMRIIGWRCVGRNAATAIWVPVIIAQLAVTLSAAVGIAGKTILNTERFADTLALTTGNDDVSIDVVSPTGDVIAHAVVDLKGFSKVEFTFDLGSGTDCNCLFALL